MSIFEVQILQPSGTILEIETTSGSNISKVEIIQEGGQNLEIIEGISSLPANFTNLVDAEIIEFIEAGSGVLLSASSSGLIISSTINAGSGIILSHNHGIYTISLSGDFQLSPEQIDDRINSLLQADDYITLNYNDEQDQLVIGVTGLQPSGDYSLNGHTHTVSDINGFNSGVLNASSGIYAPLNSPGFSGTPTAPTAPSGSNSTQIANTSFVKTEINSLINGAPSGLNTLQELASAINNDVNFFSTISSGLAQKANLSGASFSGAIAAPSGSFNVLQQNGIPVSVSGHQHSYTDIINFNSTVSGLLPVTNILGSEYINVSSSSGTYIVTSSGLQPSGNYSIAGHSHTSSDIIDFINSVNTIVSGVYAPLNSPSFTGTPVAPTAPSGTNTDQIASTKFVRTEISNIVNSAPSTLDTLNELASALGNDPNFATTIASGLGQKANLSGASFTGPVTAPSGNFSILQQSGIPVSVSGHQHSYTDITNFASGIEQEVSTLLVAGNYISINYDSLNDTLTVSATGVQPSGNYSLVGHTHTSSNISDFNSSVSGLLPVKNVVGSGYAIVSSSSGIYTISTSGLQPSGNYSTVGHSHIISDISGLQTSLDNKASLSGANFTGPISSNSGTFDSIKLKLGDINNPAISFSGIPTKIYHGLNTNSLSISLDGINKSVEFMEGLSIFKDEVGVENTLYCYSLRGSRDTSTGFDFLYDGFTNIGIMDCYSNNIHSYRIGPNGAFSIGTTVPSGTVHVSGVSNFSGSVFINSIPVSVSGHAHVSTNITDFNSAVSGLLPVKNIVSGSGISITSSSGIYTVNSTVDSVGEASAVRTIAFNKTGVSIPKMSVVYINGGQGDQPTIALALASGEMTSSKTYGITAENIDNMSLGKVVVVGALTGVNTDQFNPSAPSGNVNGVTLWLSPTTPGGLTTTKPVAPYHMVSVGTIVRTHQNEGVVEVRIQNGFELEELHNVAISGVSGGQFLQYNSSTQLWIPSNSGNFSSLSVNGTGVSINGHTHSATDIIGFNSSVSGLLPVTNILGGSNISVVPSGTTFTVSVSGTLGLTTEEVDDRVSNLLVAGSGISLNYNDNSNILTISTSGLQPSGNYASSSHTHILNDISNINGNRGDITVSSSGTSWLLNNESINTQHLNPALLIDCGLIAETVIVTDPSWANVSLLLPLDGANDSTSIVDSSNSPTSFTNTNILLKSAITRFGPSSAYMAGNGNATTTSSKLVVGTNNFTLELWAYSAIANNGDRGIIHLRSSNNTYSGLGIGVTSFGKWGCYAKGAEQVPATGPVNQNTWVHLAISRNNNVLKFFINGTEALSTSDTTNYSMNSLFLGNWYNNTTSYAFNGYVDDVRLTIGVSRYNSSFSVPTAAHPTS